MDPGLRTPLLDFFRRGEVARDVRLLAAQGALAPRAPEQLGLLMLLVSDHDPEVARAAEATLTAIPREPLAAFLARSDASIEMRAFFSARGIEPAAAPAEAADAPLLDTAPGAGPVAGPPAPGDARAASGAPAADGPVEDGADGAQEADDGQKESVTSRLASMTVAQRVTVAMKGTREERAILIRDPNKLVSTAVLSSPKLNESEIESFAKMANVSEEILRIIGSNRAWVKSYNVMLALTRNPKTPVAMSMNLLARLTDRDLRQISQNRNVPEILRITARKKVVLEK